MAHQWGPEHPTHFGRCRVCALCEVVMVNAKRKGRAGSRHRKPHGADYYYVLRDGSTVDTVPKCEPQPTGKGNGEERR
jgi:hypothetical protein